MGITDSKRPGSLELQLHEPPLGRGKLPEFRGHAATVFTLIEKVPSHPDEQYDARHNPRDQSQDNPDVFHI